VLHWRTKEQIFNIVGSLLFISYMLRSYGHLQADSLYSWQTECHTEQLGVALPLWICVRAGRALSSNLRRDAPYPGRYFVGFNSAFKLPESVSNHEIFLPNTLRFISREASSTIRHWKAEVTLQLRAVNQSVCQGIEPTLRLVTRYYFLSGSCCLKVGVLSLRGALSDERSGLSFVILSL
jgi:hypothetical protein